MSRNNFGHIQHIDSNKYRIFWSENGRRRSKTINGTKKDATATLARIASTLQEVPFMISWNEYYEAIVRKENERIADKTRYEYDRLYYREIQPRIGKLYMSKTTYKDIQWMLDKVDSAYTQRAVYRLISKICNLAIRDNYIARNLCQSNINLKPLKKKHKELLSVTDIDSWINALKDSKYFVQLLLELGGGLRHEEACAIEWEDIARIDECLVVDVNKAIVIVGSTPVLKQPKTAGSYRKVVVGEPFAHHIAERKGSPLCHNPMSFTHNYKDYCHRHDLKYVKCANLRSNYAQLHAQAGSLDSLVSVSMGHSTQSTKSKNYQQASLQSGLIIARNLAHFLLEKPKEDVTISPL